MSTKEAPTAARIPIVRLGVESDDGGHGSPEHQVETIREHGPANEGGRFCVGEFTESGHSGFHGERGPETQAAIDAATAAAAEYGEAELWIFHTSRAARGSGRKGQRSFMKLWADLLYADVQVRSVADDEFATRPVLVGVASEQNHKYSADMSAHVKRGLAKVRSEGRRQAGRVHDGYLCERDRRDDGTVTAFHYDFDPDREAFFRRVFAMGLLKVNAATITKTINAEGWRTKAWEVKKGPNKGTIRGGKHFIRQRIVEVLTDPWYAGLVAYNRKGRRDFDAGEPVEGDHPAYVTLAEHEQLVEHYGPTKRPGKIGRPAEKHLLDGGKDGLGACGEVGPDGHVCGYPLLPVVGRYVRKDGTRKLTYVCSSQSMSTGHCSAFPVDAGRVDADLLTHLDGAFLDIAGWFERIAAARSTTTAGLTDDLARERATVREAEALETKLADRYAEHVGTDDTLAAADAAALARQTKKREQAEASVRNIEAALTKADAPTTVDVALDLHNELVGQVRGALGSGALPDIRDGLRDVFARFYVREDRDTHEITVQPELRPDAGAFAALYEDGMRLIAAEAVLAAEEALRDPATADAFGDRVAARSGLDVDADSEAMNDGQPSAVLADLLAVVGERADVPPAVAAVLAEPPAALPLEISPTGNAPSPC